MWTMLEKFQVQRQSKFTCFDSYWKHWQWQSNMQNLQKNIQHCRLVIAEIHEDTPKYHYCLQPKISKIVKNPDHANIARNNSDKCINHVRRGSGKKILLNTKIHFTFLNFTSIALLKLFFPQECQIKSDLLRIDGYTWLGLDSTGQSTGRANIKSPFRSKTFAYFCFTWKIFGCSFDNFGWCIFYQRRKLNFNLDA